MELFRSWFYWSLFGLRLGWWKCRRSAPERALAFVRQGVFFDLVFAHRIFVGVLGEIFAYGDAGIVYVFNQERAKVTRQRYNRHFEPERYDVYENERVLFVVDGEVVSSPVIGTGVPMEQDILSDFNRGDAVKQALDSLSEGNRLNWDSLRWVLLVGAIAVIGFVVWKFILKGHLPGVVTPTPTPMPSPSPSPIYTLYQWVLWGANNV